MKQQSKFIGGVLLVAGTAIGAGMLALPVSTEPEMVSILIHDPENEFQYGKRMIEDKQCDIRVVYQTPDLHKLVLVPRYKPFTELCRELASNHKVKLLEIGSHSKVSLDVLYKREDATKIIPDSKLLYEMEILQDAEKRRYATYQVDVAALAAFERSVGVERIEYVHE